MKPTFRTVSGSDITGSLRRHWTGVSASSAKKHRHEGRVPADFADIFKGAGY